MSTAESASRFINRELSWLEFNQRVLDEAWDARVPLLERLKFLAITGSNLDEFFMVRVGGLQTLAEQGHQKTDPAGLTPAQQLEAISLRTHRMIEDQYTCYLEHLQPALAHRRIVLVRPAELTERQARIAEQAFANEIYPIASPMAVSGATDFPLVANLSLNLCIRLTPASADEEPRFTILPLGRSMPRFITLPSEGGYCCMLIEDLIGMYLDRYFPGEEAIEGVPFRISRNADLGVREDLAPDLLKEMMQVLIARSESDCVRLELASSASTVLRSFLQRCLDVENDYVYDVPGPLELSAFMQLSDLSGFDELKFRPMPPLPSPDVDPKQSMFEILSERDLLLYHPFESFEPVVRLIQEAADDPDVLSIKMVLYRTSGKSPIVAALKRAAEQGKYVTAVIELRARFDEARNIEWARELERASVQVIYGVKGFKIHAKVVVIVRREPQGICRYVHYGTGNYNESTARLYTDVSYMSSRPELGADATTFFNTVNGYTRVQEFLKIEAAPIGLREKLLELISSEIAHRRQGHKSHIMAKFNSLVDPEVIDALYAASQAGVKIQLVVRGICCLRPGLSGLSDNITVVSIVDRFLEHSRIFYFRHGGDDRVFISSADWMPRNLDRRLELFVPVEDRHARERLITVLKTTFNDRVKGRTIRADGSFSRVPEAQLDQVDQAIGSQEVLYATVQEAIREAEQSQRLVFVPHRAPGSEV